MSLSLNAHDPSVADDGDTSPARTPRRGGADMNYAAALPNSRSISP
jgi:hypothetical protein